MLDRPGTREQTRARYPDMDGHVERDGVRVFYEVYGAGEQTVLFMPTWEIVHSRTWRSQIPYLARHCRVICFDPRGNGRSDRPSDASEYDQAAFADDAVAVLDAVSVERAIVVSLSLGAQRTLILGDRYPERVDGAVFICPAVALGRAPEGRDTAPFDAELEADEGWNRYNRGYWEREWPGFLEFFFSEMFSEPHSTKQREDSVGWGLETDPDTIALGEGATGLTADETLAICARWRPRALVLQGDADRITGPERGVELARALGCTLVLLEGSGHGPHARDPVRVNLLIRDFLRGPPPRAARRQRAHGRRRRALYISSPIGLGHARRDVAIADELRRLHPDLQIEWLAQHPVTAVLEARGERIHPASPLLANESAHIAAQSSEHHLHCFQAIRRMDEILVANFMVFHDVVRDEPYDLWIADEAWEVDHFLHENPQLKTAPYAWLTDFVGWLPMPEGGAHEAFLTADLNAEMIEHIARYPRLRDRSIFVGDPGDIVPDTFGPGLPRIREWTQEHYDFSGYVTGFGPHAPGDRDRLRAELGYRPDDRVCIVSVGGSGVGAPLLRRVIEAHAEAKALVPGLRMVVVAGPRIDPGRLPPADGVEVRQYVPDLHRHLAACDLAVVQGGLTTTMELTAHRRPFLYFPLRGHFEQNRHVRHRLERYGAGRRMDFADATPGLIASAIAEEIGRDVDYLPVATDGAARAAGLIGGLVEKRLEGYVRSASRDADTGAARP
jgi:pimeloyl-ACP methyl ester carboxylesterase/predicted glycosyltransferase